MIRLPCRFDKAGPQEDVLGSPNDEEDSYLVPSVHEPELFQCLRSCLSHLSLLWELVLLGEPIVVMAPFPDVASSVVQSLISLIWPLSYGYDFRPYFTVQDGDFKHFVLSKQESGGPLNVILGTTNPFFIKALENWPHVLRLPKDDHKSNNRRGTTGSHKVRTNMALILNDEKFGLFSKYKGYLSKNGSLLKKVVKGMHCNRPAEAQTLIIRRYFMDLTHSFLLPLEQYLANGMPLRREISPWKDPPKMKMFDVEEFLKFLQNYGMKTVTGIKGDWPGLYRAFCTTSTFLKWLNGRQTEANVKLKLIHLETLCQTPLSSALAAKVEVEMVDFILKLKEARHFAETHADVVSEDLRHRINGQYRTALGFVKEDLKMILERSSPSAMGSSD